MRTLTATLVTAQVSGYPTGGYKPAPRFILTSRDGATTYDYSADPTLTTSRLLYAQQKEYRFNGNGQALISNYDRSLPASLVGYYVDMGWGLNTSTGVKWAEADGAVTQRLWVMKHNSSSGAEKGQTPKLFNLLQLENVWEAVLNKQPLRIGTTKPFYQDEAGVLANKTVYSVLEYLIETALTEQTRYTFALNPLGDQDDGLISTVIPYTTVASGSFVVGRVYKILTVGTDFVTEQYAKANTVGTRFIAQVAGTGTGTATASIFDINPEAVAPSDQGMHDSYGAYIQGLMAKTTKGLWLRAEVTTQGTPDVITFKVMYPQSTDAVVKTYYSDPANGHPFYEVQHSLVQSDANHVEVYGGEADPPTVFGEWYDPDEYTTVTAGSFVTGKSYYILTVGTTDFTLIGATANAIGIRFTATGAGSGTGTAKLDNARFMPLPATFWDEGILTDAAAVIRATEIGRQLKDKLVGLRLIMPMDAASEIGDRIQAVDTRVGVARLVNTIAATNAISADGGYISLVRASDGKLWAAYADSGNNNIYVAYSNDSGATWIEELAKADSTFKVPSSVDARHLALCLDSNDKPHLFWLGTTLVSGFTRNAIKYANRVSGSWSTTEVVFTAIPASEPPILGSINYLGVCIGSNNTFHIMATLNWSTPTSKAIIYISGTTGSWGAAANITTNFTLLAANDIAITSTNIPVVSYCDSTGIRYNSRAGGTWGNEEAVATEIQEVSKLVVDSSDNIHVIFKSSGVIKYRKRTSGVWGTVKTVASVNNDPFATIDTSNAVYVVYLKGAASDIYYTTVTNEVVGSEKLLYTNVNGNALYSILYHRFPSSGILANGLLPPWVLTMTGAASDDVYFVAPLIYPSDPLIRVVGIARNFATGVTGKVGKYQLEAILGGDNQYVAPPVSPVNVKQPPQGQQSGVLPPDPITGIQASPLYPDQYLRWLQVPGNIEKFMIKFGHFPTYEDWFNMGMPQGMVPSTSSTRWPGFGPNMPPPAPPAPNWPGFGPKWPGGKK